MPAPVSILVPSYNHAAFLRACLASVVAQTYQNWELILIDDGSRDGSLDIAREIADARFQILENPRNLGTYGTLQRALDLAKGEFVAVLDSDDVWEPTKLERQLVAIGDAPFGYTLGDQIDEGGQIRPDDPHGDWPREPKQDLLPYLVQENRVLASSVLFRRAGLAFHPECRYSGDWVALLEAAAKGPAACVAEPLSHWRMHGHNTFRRSPGQVAEEIAVRRAILARFQDQPKASLARCALHLSALHVLRGETRDARVSARLAARLDPSPANLKRLALTLLPPETSRARLWPGEPPLEASPIPALALRA